MLLRDERDALCGIGRRLAGTGLVTGASGNISVRSGDLVAVTPGGMMLDRMEPADCPVVNIAGHWVDGDKAPSSETPMHLALYETTPAAAIVHTHSTYGAVVATTMSELPPIHYNTLLLGGVVKVAEYATYGTPELAENVRAAMAGGKRAALMANHGGVTIGRDLEEAYENARLLEWLCGVYVRARTIGEPRVLTEEELAKVVERGLAPPDFPRV
ncbi:class II aldolase/adducin family protein [Actinomadura citrea]|jgi:L-fuculose-phosphate aldolase|uniref:L-fuculose-phosphate aldolase n=1 Tax=Actinomadura citrea TaxID=46158 RepID=A0A7Y9GF27_9ACTN|nr:class II aldolase/adducin family protein [Actinomadura citrea]NYE15316.1 L-fuculose-phosphate aldolase [Actinomadura citrea]GGU00092.1 fuculose phosphate aldolase [Actinomadura citrea]